MALSELVFDAATNERDVRHALDYPTRQSNAVVVGIGFLRRAVLHAPTARLPG